MKQAVFFLTAFLILHLASASDRARADSPALKQLVLVDGSGSMAGFFATGELNRLNGCLLDQPDSRPDLYYFVNHDFVTTMPSAFGARTFLGDALSWGTAQKPSILWIISDNQSSVGGQTESDGDLSVFYDGMVSDVVKRIYLFPIKLPFRGTLLNEIDKPLTTSYDNLRGLLVYALLLDDGDQAKDAFDRIVHRFEDRLNREFPNQARGLCIKPVERNTLTASLKGGNKLQYKEGVGIIGRGFETGKPIEGDFTLELVSQFPGMTIDNSIIDASAPVAFQTGDFNVPPIRPKIDPTQVSSLEPQGKKLFHIRVQLDTVNMRVTPASLWNCIVHSHGVITGNIRITLAAPKENFTVAKDVANTFSTDKDVFRNPDPAIQSRIYRLDDLVRRFIPAQAAMRPRIGNDAEGNIPVRLEVKYPRWPTWLALLGIGLPVLLIVAGSLYARQQAFYRLLWDGEKYRACADFRLWPLVPKLVEIDGRRAAKIKAVPLSGVWVNAQHGYTIDDRARKAIHPAGTDFIIRRQADDAVISFSFSSARGLTQSPEGANDVFADAAYAGGESRYTTTPLSTSPPPIRKVTTAEHGSGGGDSSPAPDHYDPYSY